MTNPLTKLTTTPTTPQVAEFTSTNELDELVKGTVEDKFLAYATTMATHDKTYFAGFEHTDLPTLKPINDLALFKKNPQIGQAMAKLVPQLKESKLAELQPLIPEMEKIVQQPDLQTGFSQAVMMMKIAITISDYTDEEAQFFSAARFGGMYKLGRTLKQGEGDGMQTLIGRLIGFDPEQDEWDNTLSELNIFHAVVDTKNVIEREVQKSLFMDRITLLPGAGELGLAFLAFTYLKGIHPIPIPLTKAKEMLHGIAMSPWGQVCHDMAHSQADDSERSLEQFANRVMGHYLDVLKEKRESLTPTEMKQYRVGKLMPAVSAYAVAVNDLYRQTLVDLFLMGAHERKLPSVEGVSADEMWKAYVTATFLSAHERPSAIDDQLHLLDPVEILRKATQDDTAASSTKKTLTPSMSDDEKRRANAWNWAISKDPFNTCPRTGTMRMDEAEAKGMIAELPYSAFSGYTNWDRPINKDDIAAIEIKNTPFFTAATVYMIDGSEQHLVRETQRATTLNFEHDSKILLQAKELLSRKYGFEIPSIPSPDLADETYMKAAKSFRAEMEKGMRHLIDFYVEISTHLADQVVDQGGETYREQFRGKALAAREALEPQLPSGFGPLLWERVEASTENK